MNRCVFQKIVSAIISAHLLSLNADVVLQGLEKTIPDTPKGDTPVHLRDKQVYADHPTVVYPWEKDVGIRKDAAQQQ